MQSREKNVDDKASELYNDFLGICYHRYMSYQMIKEKKIESKYDPKDLFLDEYGYSVWLEKEEERLIKKNLKIYHRCCL